MHRPSARPAGTLLLLLVLLAACAGTDASPSASTASTAPDPTDTHAASAGPTEALTAEPPVLAEGVISTDAEEYRISFMPDGATAYFARGDGFFPQTRDATIYETRLEDGAWTEPEVASFSGEFPDIDPWVSPDGSYLLFSSIRPVDGEEGADVELFRVDRYGDAWGEPVHLASLGSERDELGATVAEDGTLIFASDRAGGVGGWDLYTAAADGDGWGEPIPLDDLNTQIWEFNPAIDASGQRLVFTSINREGGIGLGDLFTSVRDGDAWETAVPLTMNTGADEYHPSLSPDGATLYFVLRQGDGDLYEIPWSAVDPG
jgi:Tol biopolymer transport system component